MTTKIQLRRDVIANWTSVNPSLSSGEPGYETDTGKLKIGDGTSNWTSLSYLFDPANFNVALANVTHANNTTLTGTNTYIRGDVHAYTSGGATHQQFQGFYATGLTSEPTEYWAGRYATTTATGAIRRNFLKAADSSATLNSCFTSGTAQVGASTETAETTSFLQASGATNGTFPGTGFAMVLACATTTPSGMIAGNAISSRLALNTSSGVLNLEITANGSYSQARFYGTGNSTILYDSNSILTRGYADTRYIQSTANGSVSDLTVGGDLVVSGNLTINGTTTTLNSVTLTVDDKNIELGSVANATNVTADGGGLTLKGTTDKSLIWYNATSSWTSSENLSLVTDKSYRINDVVVLSNTALGTGVTGSCLTSVGTLSTGVWQGSTIGVTYGGTGATTLTGYVKGSGTSALTACATIPGADISGNITGNAAGLTGTLTVAFGGTGVTTLTSGSYLKGNGTGAITTSSTIPVGDLSGTLSVAGGGTGVTTLTSGSYVKGNGTGGLTTSATIPGSDISGNITGAAGNVTGVIAVTNGGTGVNTLLLNGYLRGNGTGAVTACTTILGSVISGDIAGNANSLTSTLGVAKGGTGSITFTAGYVKANGTTAMTSSATIPVGDLSGTISVAGGGTGATTLTGYVKGSGTSALTASSTIPGSDISGNITGNAAGLTSTLTVGFGGTGATTLTGYVKGSGTSAFTASSTIPGSDISGNITGAAGNVTGVVAIANGGTGGANATAALSNLGAAARGANSDITSLSGLTTALSVAQGGTGVATLTGLVKANGTSAFVAAVAGTDYLSPSSTIDGGTF